MKKQSQQSTGLTSNIKAILQDHRIAAVQDARKQAQELVGAALGHLEQSGWDLDIAYPYPKTTIGKSRFNEALKSRQFAQQITKSVSTLCCRNLKDPYLVQRDDAAIDRYLKSAEQASEESFLAFVVKLTQKIGDAVSVSLSYAPKDVWDYSLVEATYPDGSVKTLKTQRIINRRGWTLYHQWPTRFVN